MVDLSTSPCHPPSRVATTSIQVVCSHRPIATSSHPITHSFSLPMSPSALSVPSVVHSSSAAALESSSSGLAQQPPSL